MVYSEADLGYPFSLKVCSKGGRHLYLAHLQSVQIYSVAVLDITAVCIKIMSKQPQQPHRGADPPQYMLCINNKTTPYGNSERCDIF